MPMEALDIHNKVDNGKVYMIPYLDESVANNGSIYIRHRSGTSNLHSLLTINTVGKWKFESFSNSSYSNNGTLINPIPRKTTQKELQSDFWVNPTVAAEGDLRLPFMFGSGEVPSRESTSQYGESLESIFESNVDVLIKITNLSGSDQYLSLIFNVYEE